MALPGAARLPMPNKVSRSAFRGPSAVPFGRLGDARLVICTRLSIANASVREQHVQEWQSLITLGVDLLSEGGSSSSVPVQRLPLGSSR